MILSGGKGASCVPGDKENSKWIIWGSTLCTLHDSSLHAATVTECDKIHRGSGDMPVTDPLNTFTR